MKRRPGDKDARGGGAESQGHGPSRGLSGARALSPQFMEAQSDPSRGVVL